ncbi:MAG: glycosyltransferase family 39 protein [Nanoarchaeota archaeon]|nr:glycosyltransferase family 39 protein [Nanoarchaeota archaeon]
MADRKEKIILLIIFLLVLTLRLSFTLTQANFSDDVSYQNIDQVKSIMETGHPSSYYMSEGKIFMTSAPLFYYILSFFSIIIPINLVAKILPQIFAASLSIIIYFLSMKITRNKKVSYLNALIGGTIPIFLKSTTNTVSVSTFAIPLFFLALYFLLDINNNKRSAYIFLALAILLTLTSSISIILVLSLLSYIILIKSTHLKNDSKELEITLFTSFIVIWFTAILFKNIFLFHGYNTIWQNTPAQILQIYFSEINFLEAIYAIGIIPFIAGISVIYQYLINRQKRSIYLFSSVIILSFALMWFRLVKSVTALTILGISLIIISSQAYLDISKSFLNTKAPAKKTILIILTIFLILASLIPSFIHIQQASENAFNQKEMNALEWIKAKTPEGAVIASMYNEGHIIKSVAEREVLLNQNFLLFSDAQQRLNAQSQIFSAKFATNALRETTKYNVKYIYFSQKAKDYFEINSIHYINNECFDQVYNDEIIIYKVKCVI